MKSYISNIILLFTIVGFVSCESESANDLTEIPESISDDNTNSLEVSNSVASKKILGFDEVYNISLSNYEHVRQNLFGKCGPTAYTVARKMKNPSYPNAYSNIDVIYNLTKAPGVPATSVYSLYLYQDNTSKSFIGKPAGNNQFGNGREALKAYILENLKNDRPVVIPTKYNMSMSTNAAGHFYIIVSLWWKNGGTGSRIGVKDVFSPDSSTRYFSYTDLLNSNWLNSNVKPGNRNYSALAFN